MVDTQRPKIKHYTQANGVQPSIEGMTYLRLIDGILVPDSIQRGEPEFDQICLDRQHGLFFKWQGVDDGFKPWTNVYPLDSRCYVDRFEKEPDAETVDDILASLRKLPGFTSITRACVLSAVRQIADHLDMVVNTLVTYTGRAVSLEDAPTTISNIVERADTNDRDAEAFRDIQSNLARLKLLSEADASHRDTAHVTALDIIADGARNKKRLAAIAEWSRAFLNHIDYPMSYGSEYACAEELLSRFENAIIPRLPNPRGWYPAEESGDSWYCSLDRYQSPDRNPRQLDLPKLDPFVV